MGEQGDRLQRGAVVVPLFGNSWGDPTYKDWGKVVAEVDVPIPPGYVRGRELPPTSRAIDELLAAPAESRIEDPRETLQ